MIPNGYKVGDPLKMRAKSIFVRRLNRIISIAVVGLLGGAGLTTAGIATPASAVVFNFTFLINDVRMIPDAVPGDGVCQTSGAIAPNPNTCTMYAAVQEANAQNTANPAATVLVSVAPLLIQGNGTTLLPTGSIMMQKAGAPPGPDGSTAAQNNPGNTSPMITTAAAMNAAAGAFVDSDSQVWFDVQGQVTFDFQNRLGSYSTQDLNPLAVMILIRGQNASLRNFSTISSNEAVIYVGTAAQNILIENGTIQNPPGNFNAERSIAIVAGAQNITISNITFGSVYRSQLLFIKNGANIANNVTVDRSDFNNDSQAIGPFDNRPTGIGVWGQTGIPVSNFRVTNSTFRDFNMGVGLFADRGDAISTAGLTLTNATIQGNTFSRSNRAITGWANAEQIYLHTPATNLAIRNNVFRWDWTTQPNAPAINSDYAGSNSGTTIEDNTIVNWDHGLANSIRLGNSLGSTIQTDRNTMSNSGGSTTAATENANTQNPLFLNSANNTIRTAFPSAAVIPVVPACSINVTLQNPSGGSGGIVSTAFPELVDVYFSQTPAAGDGLAMEQYVGRTIVNAAVNYVPVLGFTANLPYTGGPGVVRVQTIDALNRSSQYSRTVALTGTDNCPPQMWIQQALSQADPAVNRNVTFQVQSSEPLGANTLTAGDISFAGSTASNPSVVSVTQTGKTTWTVVAKANTSGTIVASIPAGSVDDPVGNVQALASNSTAAPLNFAVDPGNPNQGMPGPSIDHTVTYVSPLSIAPATISVTEAGAGVPYTVTTSKAPTADVTMTQGFAPPGLATAAPSPLVLQSTDSTVNATVTAIDNTIVDGSRPTTLSHVVTSTDPEFNGLELATIAVTVDDNDQPVAANSSFAVSSGTRLANGADAHTATTTIRNALGQAVQNAVVTFNLPAGVTANAVVGPGTTTAVSDASGVAAISITSGTPGTYSISATVNPTFDPIGSPQNITFVSAPIDAAQSALVITPAGPLVANGVAQYTATFTARDSSGNTVAFAPVFFTVGGGATGGGGVTTDSNGVASISITSTSSGSKLVSVYDGTSAAGPLLNTGNAVFVAGPADANQSTISASPTVAATGGPGSTITVQLRDINGNLLTTSGGTVTMSAPASSGVLTPVVDNGNGTYTSTLTDTVTETVTVNFTVNAVTSTNFVQVSFISGGPDAAASTLAVTPGNRLANGTDGHTATVTVRDSNNNLVAGATVAFTVCAGATPTSPTAVSDVNGIASIAVTSNTPGSCGVTATIGGVGVSGSPASVVFVVGPVDVSASSFVIDAGPKTADGVDAFTLTVTAMDSFGHVVPGVTVDFAAQAGATLGAPSGVTNGSGVASTTATATVAGTYQLSATIGGVSVPGSPQPGVFVAGPVNAGLSAYTVTAGTVLADGVAQHQATVVAKDANGNPVSGVTVNFAVPAGATGSAPSAVTDGSGTASITITSTTAGTYSIGATIAAVPVDGSPKSVTFGPGAADASTSSWVVTPPGPITADGVAAYTATATARDAFSNPVPGAMVTFTVPAQVTASAPSCTASITGMCSVTFTSTTAGSYTATAGIGANLIAPNRTLVYVAGAASTGTSTITAVPTSIPANGVAASTITVRLRDAQGNPLTASGGLVVMSASVGTISLTTDNGDGTYTATLTSTGVQGTTTPSTVSFTINAIPAAATATVILVDAVAPPPPTVNPTNGTTVSGTGQTPGDIITVRNAANVVIGTGTVAADGSFSFTIVPTPTPVNGDVLSVTETDPSGNESPPVFVTVDTVPPAPPVVNPTNGSVVSGTAEPGSTVTVSGPGPVVLCTATAGPTGAFSCMPAPVPTNGTILTVTATDPSGNVSPPTSVTVDSVPPAPPVVNPTNGSVVSGTAEPGSTVTVSGPGPVVLCTATAGPTGAFSCVPSPTPGNGTVLSITATDAAGNVSPSTSVTVDSVPPAPPVVNPTNGSVVSGTAEPGSTVTVSGPGPVVLCTATAGPTGAFSCVPSPTPGNGTVLSVTATDPSGNVSPPTSVTVDSVPPAPPVVNPTNGSVVSGTAEPGSTVTVSGPGPVVLCTATAGPTGAFSCMPAPVPTNGTILTVTATDPSGNVSPPTSVTVDSVPPAPPVVNPTNGSVVSGTAEPGSTVTVSGPGPVVLCTATAGPTGAFSCVPSPTPGNGTVLSITATDAAGNVSPSTSVTVDSVPPAPPVVNPTNGSVVSGTAEPGSTVTVSGPGPVVLCTAVASSMGQFACTPSPAPTNGQVLSVTATDAAGNVSPPTSVTVDTVPPAPPVVNPTNGSVVSGTAEPGSTVTVTGPGPVVLCTATADPVTGAFSCTPSSTPPNGTILTVTATDPSGNVSPPTSVTVDSVPPAPPVVNPTNGSVVSGTAEPGSTVTVSGPGPVVLCTATAGPTGAFSCVPSPTPGNGTVLSITATDAAGNVSPSTSVTVDSVPPAPPVVNPTNGSVVSGTAEPGSTVTVSGPGPVVLCTATADSVTGAFSCVPSPTPGNGTVLSITATDAAGNVSLVTSVTVHANLLSIAFDSTTLHPGDTAVAVGSGFLPGESVTGVMNSSPLSLGVQIADTNGTVTFTWVIPDNTDAGFHEVVLTGELSGSVSGMIEIILREVAALLALSGLETVPNLGALFLVAIGILVLAARRRSLVSVRRT